MKGILYRDDITPDPEDIVALYLDSGLRRPTSDINRIRTMFENSNLIITAWKDDELIGVARSITDWAWSCYLADLSVSYRFKHQGIGKALIKMTKQKVGNQCMVLPLSVPEALAYSPK